MQYISLPKYTVLVLLDQLPVTKRCWWTDSSVIHYQQLILWNKQSDSWRSTAWHATDAIV